jgi:iron uptake system component EfeO
VARIAALSASIAVVLAACGAATPSAAPSTGPLPSGSVAVEAKDYEFTPATLTVPEGTTTFVVTNAAGQEHEFEIFLGETVIDEIEGLVPGLTKQLPVTLQPGEYTYVCKLNGHDQLGMKGKLTVTAK